MICDFLHKFTNVMFFGLPESQYPCGFVKFVNDVNGFSPARVRKYARFCFARLPHFCLSDKFMQSMRVFLYFTPLTNFTKPHG